VRISRVVIFASGLILAGSGLLPLAKHALADTPAATINLNISASQPRAVEDTTTQSVTKVYSKAWADLDRALSTNNASLLSASFVGFARDRFATQIKTQAQSGMATHWIARGHQAQVVFYSVEGSALEIKDQVQLERQILDGGKVIASETKTIPFDAILSVTDDGWKVRVLTEAQ
jgi:hypothetical protein